ncbi:MAG: hypothetical protein F6K36_22095 [Symploca sp. SIO3C6]|nr:hypothetical protein [Symploca sp. SIO3C6]
MTDRCPVGCSHCSVDSRPNSPTISDFSQFEGIVKWICRQSYLTTVGITGGEPFVERRGLTLAVANIAHAGKDIVLYTSGIWAKAKLSQWIKEVLQQVNCVFLSTDSFHSKTVDDESFVKAAQAIAAEGTWLVIQVLAFPETVRKVRRLLEKAFGGEYSNYAELNLVQPLRIGRGVSVFDERPGKLGQDFGRCSLLASPVIRYDGVVSACCNEHVIMDRNEQKLRRLCHSNQDIEQSILDFKTDPLLQAFAHIGLGNITGLPGFTDLANQEFPNICSLCKSIRQRMSEMGDSGNDLVSILNFIALEDNYENNH